mmetsp:Transcript_21523/g.43218  ORF Transcript_21523/g.43218 Transcript_21523/m.43218 type:complete len:112 (-) Transcript_21523:507-842(-)
MTNGTNQLLSSSEFQIPRNLGLKFESTMVSWLPLNRKGRKDFGFPQKRKRKDKKLELWVRVHQKRTDKKMELCIRLHRKMKDMEEEPHRERKDKAVQLNRWRKDKEVQLNR